MRYGIEEARISFVIERDGLMKAVAFAKQTRGQYRRHVLEQKRLGKNCGIIGPETYIVSYLIFKRFIQDNT